MSVIYSIPPSVVVTILRLLPFSLQKNFHNPSLDKLKSQAFFFKFNKPLLINLRDMYWNCYPTYLTMSGLAMNFWRNCLSPGCLLEGNLIATKSPHRRFLSVPPSPVWSSHMRREGAISGLRRRGTVKAPLDRQTSSWIIYPMDLAKL